MAVEDVDLVNLFSTNDYDDVGMSNIDFQSVLKLHNEDDNYDALKEVNGPGPEDCASKNASPNESGILDTSHIQKGSQVLEEPHFSGLDLVDSGTRWSPFCLGISDSWAGGSDSLFDSAVKSLRDRKHDTFPGDFVGDVFSFAENDEIWSKQRTGVSTHEIPSNGVESSHPEAHSYGENKSQFKHVREDAEYEYASLSSIIENGYGENIIGGSSGNQENGLYTNFGNPIMDADKIFPVESSTNSTVGQDSRVPDNFINYQLSSNCYQGTYGGPIVSDSSTHILPYGMPSQPWTNDEMESNMKAENEKSYADMASARMSSDMHSRTICSNECFKNEDTYAAQPSTRSNNFQHIIDGTNSNFAVDRSLPHAPAPIANENQFACVKRGGGEMIQHKHVDSEKVGNYLNISQSSKHVNSHPNMVESTRLKAREERNILQVALQVLSQPKSEDSPPDGLLAVPLLRHQRIALSWMVQKETSISYGSGGILADDQGLGKTVTTIALILKERPPGLTVCPNVQKGELEASNLSMNLLEQAKGRPSAGTLIVCPTCVLNQWAEELQNKVTSQANLSVLVYYGRNRTKDPYEVAKYDVVLTTYATVSIEALKKPIVNKDGEEKGIFEVYAVPSRKRKDPSSSNMSGKKELDSTMLEAAALPLAKVEWFRVVLDEAQSIKNHKTLVARACWDLHAKRRWCLSGTPIQNSIDDLYSYFKFLRYYPDDSYASFCSTIKVPISKNPTTGYRKLQAVLNTIMLRRTKGTLLDGEPIISLPPKFVELKKVDFSREERGFYSRLEAESRAQFKKYAEAGTVQQNYVNILLMLLHLRQACDHPLLVKRYNSSSQWRSSVEMAKNLPQEKQISLSKCLEASMALCGICNDPPEDAVVSVCGHIFCNQCICERLAGDDKQCPTTNCKGQLNTASVFSKATLSNYFSNQDCDNSPGWSGSEVEEFEPWSRSHSYESSKMKAALGVLNSLCKPQCHTSEGTVVGEKAIVFTQWTSMLDLLEVSLKNSSIQYRRLDGTMSVAARDKAIKDFNALPEVSVMIMSLKAASLGLNLVVASHVLMLDLWWNPTTEDQAIDRAHRIGQTRPVTVLRLTVRDTVEDRILALQQRKRKVVAHAFGENETGGHQSHLTVDDLKCLFMI